MTSPCAVGDISVFLIGKSDRNFSQVLYSFQYAPIFILYYCILKNRFLYIQSRLYPEINDPGSCNCLQGSNHVC